MTPPLLSLFLVLAFGSLINAEEEHQAYLEVLEFPVTDKHVINDTSLVDAEEDYDFQGVTGLSLNDTVSFFNNRGGQDLPLKEAATSILMAKIETLKNTTVEKDKRIQQLMEEFVQEKAAMLEEWKMKMDEIQQQKNLEKATYEKDLTNKEVLVKFLSYRLRNQEKKARMSISYVTLLTKTLIDQTEEMKKLR